MDFRWTEDQLKLKSELADFAKEVLPPDWMVMGMLVEEWDWDLTFKCSKLLAERGWLTSHWPVEYGGAGASAFDHVIMNDEAGYWGIPGRMMGAGGTGWVGPMLAHIGSEEQKKKFIPPIAAGDPDGVWCTGYSEPDAGTDLASLKTSARRVGDEYIVNGNKIWQTYAHKARWCWLLARTNPDLPKHKGLTLMLMDMKSPGITVKPLIDIGGHHIVNETFFDDVRVPVTNMVGEENRGFYQVMQALAYERSSVATAGPTRRVIDELARFCEMHKYGEQEGRFSSNPAIRSLLASMTIENEIVKLYCYRIAWLEDMGMLAAVPASAAKVYASEVTQRVVMSAMELLGPYSQLRMGSKWAQLGGGILTMYLNSFIMRFGAGANEIQRNIISQVGLGLPR